MFITVKNVIRKGNYDLPSMLKKIDRIHMQGQITDEQKDLLYGFARDNAKTKESLKPFEEQYRELVQIVKDLSKRIEILEAAVKPNVSTDADYPDFKTPKSEFELYMQGDQITYRRNRYVCNQDYVCWSPDDYPVAWTKEKTENG